MKDKSYREAYVASQIKIGLPFQVRSLRKSRGLKQDEVASRAGMEQPRIAEIEKPGERRLNVETLLRIAAAFDVGLQIRFVPFSELIESSESFDPDNFAIKSFDEEISEAENIKTGSVQAKVDQVSTEISKLAELYNGFQFASIELPNLNEVMRPIREAALQPQRKPPIVDDLIPIDSDSYQFSKKSERSVIKKHSLEEDRNVA